MYLNATRVSVIIVLLLKYIFHLTYHHTKLIIITVMPRYSKKPKNIMGDKIYMISPVHFRLNPFVR